MSPYTVTVAGPTGKTGSRVVDLASGQRWSLRRAGRHDAGGPGTWVLLNWDDPKTWESAFSGSDAAYLLIPFNHPGAAEATPGVIAAAASSGVERIVLLSSWDAQHAADDDPLCVAERTLLDLPVQSAILRPTWFLDNFTHGSFSGMTAAGELRLPCGDGQIPFIDTRDIAALATACLRSDGATGILPATGPKAVTHHEVAAALAAHAGRPITYRSVPAEEFITLLQKRGFSREYGAFLAQALEEVASGRLAIPVADSVDRIVGRPPYSVDDFAAHHSILLRQPLL